MRVQVQRTLESTTTTTAAATSSSSTTAASAAASAEAASSAGASGGVGEMASSTFWEDLRRQARQLENELDMKLVSFSKLCTACTHRDQYSSDMSPLLSGSTQHRMFDSLSVEIEQLLSKLAAVNEKLSEYSDSSRPPPPSVESGSSNSALSHTIQRHRDILQDYSHEFHRTRGHVVLSREREDLLGLHRDGEFKSSAASLSSGVNRRTELFLKENHHLHNSDRLIDDTISIAMATKEKLTSQRGVYRSIQSKVNSLAHRFPLVNSLLQRIAVRKRRDALVLATITATCIIILILYSLH
ncbi:Golgi SNAP receptor complex member 1 isoform X3 [Petromyzon marinus]|uniref:Golgi SNAP receptor complex member 1 isoform X3 n=1 Tax=Petromyzon marinus TaxID=7757 RepID=UPI003F704910